MSRPPRLKQLTRAIGQNLEGANEAALFIVVASGVRTTAH